MNEKAQDHGPDYIAETVAIGTEIDAAWKAAARGADLRRMPAVRDIQGSVQAGSLLEKQGG